MESRPFPFRLAESRNTTIKFRGIAVGQTPIIPMVPWVTYCMRIRACHHNNFTPTTPMLTADDTPIWKLQLELPTMSSHSVTILQLGNGFVVTWYTTGTWRIHPKTGPRGNQNRNHLLTPQWRKSHRPTTCDAEIGFFWRTGRPICFNLFNHNSASYAGEKMAATGA